MQKIRTSHAPEPAGHYSQAIEHHGLVFVAGQLPKDPDTGQLTGESIEQQTRLVLQHLEAILIAANSDIRHLVKVNIYIPDISLWDRVNHIYREFMGDHQPARAVIPTGELHLGAKIEVEAVAAVRDPQE